MPLLLAELSAVDALYFGVMLLLGYRFGRRQKDTEEYFVAGRNIPSWAAGLSIFATLLSTIVYLYIPGEVIKHGVGHMASLLAYPALYLLVGYVVIPFFMHRQGTSAYEYLETRRGLSVRLFAASLFLSIRRTWMGMVIFPPPWR